MADEQGTERHEYHLMDKDGHAATGIIAGSI